MELDIANTYTLRVKPWSNSFVGLSNYEIGKRSI